MTVVVVRIPAALLFFGACLAGVTFSLTTRHLEAADEHGWRILFDSLRGGKREIYVMDTDGSNVRRLTHNEQRDARPRWSPDGKLLVFQSGTVGPGQQWSDVEIYTMNADGPNVHRLTSNEHADMHPDW